MSTALPYHGIDEAEKYANAMHMWAEGAFAIVRRMLESPAPPPGSLEKSAPEAAARLRAAFKRMTLGAD